MSPETYLWFCRNVHCTPGSSPVEPHQTSLNANTHTHFILTLCREAVATGDLGLSGLTAVEGGTLLLQHWSCGAVDCSVHCRGEDRRVRELAYLCESPIIPLLTGSLNVV